mmetsp:Transcript_6281/g.18952  ORF Transcript_6281/g.18952 Transcript_6281/m.18952 type:complete len:516 (+) Transcript_6281:201-1748(+)
MGMWGMQTLYIDDVLERIDKNMWELQSYAEFRLADKEFDEPQKAKFANIKATLNSMDSSVGKLQEVAKKLPKEKKIARTGFLAEETDNDPGEIFQDLMQPHVDKMLELAEKIGGDIYDQMLAFEEAFEAEVNIISYAASVPMPPRDELIEKCRPLTDTADDAVEYNRDCEPHDPLKSHFQAMADLATMLGWIVAPNPIKHVKEYEQIVELECGNILGNFIQLNCDPVHSDFSEVVKTFCRYLVEYVSEEHPAGLRWNYMKGSAPEGYRVKRKVKARGDAHPFLDFLEIIDGPLLDYVYYSQLIGHEVATQSQMLFNAFVKLYELITRAANTTKSGDDNAMRMYVMPVMYEIAEVTTAAEEVDREHYFHMHLKAVAEVAQVLRWVISTETTAAMYTTELSNASEMFLNRLLQRFEKKTNLEFHKLWVSALKNVLNEMKVYVIVHHYKELTFDSKYRVEEVRGLWRERELLARVRARKLANKGKVRHWDDRMKYLWGTGIVNRPIRNTRLARIQRFR